MSEAQKRSIESDTASLLTEFAKRVVDGERTADLFGVDDGFIHSVVHQAYQFYSNKSYEKAETLLRGATALDTKQSYAHLLLGDVLLQRSAYKEATSVLEHALELDSEEPQTMAKLGEAYVRVGRKSEAAPLLERSMSHFDEDSSHFKRASALLDVARRAEEKGARQK